MMEARLRVDVRSTNNHVYIDEGEDAGVVGFLRSVDRGPQGLVSGEAQVEAQESAAISADVRSEGGPVGRVVEVHKFNAFQERGQQKQG